MGTRYYCHHSLNQVFCLFQRVITGIIPRTFRRYISTSDSPELAIYQLSSSRLLAIRARVGHCLGVPGGRLDIGSLWGLYKMQETLWFCLVSGLNICVGVLVLCCMYLCRPISLHDCLVVNGTSTFIINILHGTAARLGY